MFILIGIDFVILPANYQTSISRTKNLVQISSPKSKLRTTNEFARTLMRFEKIS